MTGEVIPLDLHARRRRAGSASRAASRSARSPAISPFNFPLNLAAHKLVAGDRQRATRSCSSRRPRTR